MPSSSSSSSVSTFTDAHEFSNLVLNGRMTALVNRTFDDDPTSAAYIRHFTFIATLVEKLRFDIDQYQEEQQTILDHLLTCPRFCATLKPLTRTYRRQMRQSGFHPYTRRPTFTPSSSSSLASSSPEFPTRRYRTAPSSPIIDSIIDSYSSPDPNDFPSTSNCPPLGQLTVTPPPGSPTNPIIVDNIPDQPHMPNVGRGVITRRLRCPAVGHSDCDYGHPDACGNCHYLGHGRDDCPTDEGGRCRYCGSLFVHPMGECIAD